MPFLKTSKSSSFGLLVKALFLLKFTNILSTKASSVVSEDTVNIMALLSDYILTCGSTAGLCNSSKAPFLIEPEIIPGCADGLGCSAKCAIASTCAPDAETAYAHVSCVATTIYPPGIELQGYRYRLIATCGEISKHGSTVNSMCTDLPRIELSNVFDDTFRPVISSVSLVTYRNRYCAACNNDNELLPFELKVACDDLFDINSFSSLEDIWDAVRLHNCSVSYVPPDSLIFEAETCHDKYGLISHCNVSGLWPVYDPEIAWACKNLNSYPYKDYKNIYCYNCNPSLVSTSETEMITSCNVTGQYVNTDTIVEEGCKSLPSTPRTFPFKNIFCKMCNAINDQLFDRKFTEFSASIFEMENPRYKVYTSFSKLRFSSTITGSPNISDDTVNKIYTLDSQKGSLNASQITQKKSLEELGNFCGYENFCDRPYRKHNNSYTFPMCMFPCDEYSNCCEILSLGISPAALLPHSMLINLNQLKTEPFPVTYNNSDDLFPVIGQCPEDNTVSEVVKNKCEQEVLQDILSYIPVTSDTDRGDYKNIYCARCNNHDGDLTSHGFSVQCGQPLEATLSPTFKDIATIIRESKCNITVKSPFSQCTTEPHYIKTCQKTESEIHISPDIVNICEQAYLVNSLFPAIEMNGEIYKNVFCVMCNAVWNTSLNYDLITDCNVTGLWSLKVNTSLENLCRTTQLHHAWYPYKNVFCAVCNMAADSVTTKHFGGGTVPCEGSGCIFAHPAYRTIFTIPLPAGVPLGETENKVTDSVVFCAKGRQLVNKACQTIIGNTINLGYELTFGLILIHSEVHETIITVMRAIQEHIHDHMNGYTHDDVYTVSINISSSKPCMNMLKRSMGVLIRDSEDIHFLVETALFFDTVRNRSHLEDNLIESRSKPYNISVQNGYIIFESYPYDDSSVCQDKSVFQQHNLCIVSTFDKNATNSFQSGKIKRITDIPENVEFLYVDKLLSCVLKSLENYTNSVFEILCSEGIPFKSMSDTSIHVCASDVSRIQHEPNYRVYNTLSLAHGIFSFVCTSISLLGLIFTFITYTLFKTIRTIPGVNNMNVVITLFGAQLFTQFGLWQTGNRSRCILLGIITHYFWLGAFCSMNVCSFHMFRVFTSLVYSSRHQSKWVIMRYCIYVYVAPAFAILLFVVIKVSVGGAETVGYGGHVCFLSESLPIISMFITPACLIIVANMILSGLAYWHIRRTPHIQSNVERNDFQIYVKLLTVTGVAWPLMITDALLPLSAFSFIATFANALQGVFIFVAFICNKKIAYLYKIHCCKWYHKEFQNTESSNETQQTKRVAERSL